MSDIFEVIVEENRRPETLGAEAKSDSVGGRGDAND